MKKRVEVLKQKNNVVLKRVKGSYSDLFVEVREDDGSLKMGSQSKRLRWHFPDTKLGLLLAKEQFRFAVKGIFKPYKSKYCKEIQELTEKYYNLNC